MSESGEVKYDIAFPGFPQFNGHFERHALRSDNLPDDPLLDDRNVTDFVILPPEQYEGFRNRLTFGDDHEKKTRTKEENEEKINDIVHEFNYPSSRMFAFKLKK